MKARTGLLAILICGIALADVTVSDEAAEAARDDLNVMRSESLLRCAQLGVSPFFCGGDDHDDPIIKMKKAKDKSILCAWARQHDVSREDRRDWCADEAAADDAARAAKAKAAQARRDAEEKIAQARRDAEEKRAAEQQAAADAAAQAAYQKQREEQEAEAAKRRADEETAKAAQAQQDAADLQEYAAAVKAACEKQQKQAHRQRVINSLLGAVYVPDPVGDKRTALQQCAAYGTDVMRHNPNCKTVYNWSSNDLTYVCGTATSN